MEHPSLSTLAAGLCALLLAGACSSSSAHQAAATGDGAPDPELLALLAELQESEVQRPVDPHAGRARDGQPVRQRSRGLAAPLPAAELEFEVGDPDRPADGSTRLRMVRLPDRIQLTWPAGRELWLFVRNPVAPDELSGVRVDHASRFLIDYSDSELHSEGVVDGWARLAQGFVTPEELDGLRPDGGSVDAFGLTFVHLVAEDGPSSSGGIAELDWNAELGLPLRLVRRTTGGTRVQRLVALDRQPGADATVDLLASWPEYERKDLSDWREDVHPGEAHDQAHSGE